VTLYAHPKALRGSNLESFYVFVPRSFRLLHFYPPGMFEACDSVVYVYVAFDSMGSLARQGLCWVGDVAELLLSTRFVLGG